MSNLKIFDEASIRAKWNDDDDQWWFVVQDVIQYLTDSVKPRDYWYRLKQRVNDSDGVQLSTICRQLKFEAGNGKSYKYECANNEALFRILQSVPSPKAEPFKRWLAQLGKERIQEIEQPEKAIDRAKSYYVQKGHTSEWVDDRMQGIKSRHTLTDYWKQSGVNSGKEFAILTNQIYKSTFGLPAANYKAVKGLKNSESLRDNMTNIELVVTRFAEVTSKEIAETSNAHGLDENKKAIEDAGQIIKNTVHEIESKTGRKIISETNSKKMNTAEINTSIVSGEFHDRELSQESEI